jgi:hypothetical protein
MQISPVRGEGIPERGLSETQLQVDLPPPIKLGPMRIVNLSPKQEG